MLNHFVNMLGYSPGGSQHGYLWWLAWLDHNARTLFSVQDANGDYRPLFLQASCATLAQVASFQGGWLRSAEPDADPHRPRAVPEQAAADTSDYQLYKHGKLSRARPAARAGVEGPERPLPAPTPDQLMQPAPPQCQDRHDGAVRALVRRPAAVPVAVVRRARSRSTPRATSSRISFPNAA